MTTTERLLEKVAEGLHQLQQVQLDKLDKRSTDEAPEQCKPGTTTLPPLPAPNGNESAVALQAWLEVIDGPLRDISDSSSWWWDSVKRACDSYRVWVSSGPYERLAHKPPTAEDLEKGKFSRLSARTAGMLLQAMAETVRAEMVARSITRSPVAPLFRLYTMYQPGGESEKAYILQYLVTPPKAVEMVATLRQWERMLLRADNLSIAKPGPSLLVRALNALVGDVWAKDRDVTFRTQLVKSRLGVDVSPTWVVRFPGRKATSRLVNEIEDKKLKELKDGVSLLKSKLEHLVHEEKLPWTTYIERPAYDLGLEGQIDPTVAVRSVVFALCWLLGQVPLQSISLHAKRLLREILGSFDRPLAHGEGSKALRPRCGKQKERKTYFEEGGDLKEPLLRATALWDSAGAELFHGGKAKLPKLP
ncbi:hypothetical protein AK812_SmicGene40294 [Symbiodinium microadriaticum]|uniref:Uncharacterized protein n=1 Tax=Symbiodinium microadriaticum TaxID=2951 RepID=A0A1Q9C926_SYMMI|nr:hypothetical protein AK812_SmicGene40294 [Symbiodinium microadriaticum]